MPPMGMPPKASALPPVSLRVYNGSYRLTTKGDCWQRESNLNIFCQIVRFLPIQPAPVGGYDFPASQVLCSSQFYPWEISELTEMTKARALAASENHKEAEKRRRERINSHLDKLRSILPCNSKIDKATLLAKVVQRLRELKEQTYDLTQCETFPSETDEITINNITDYDENKVLMKASFCCEERSNLIPELIEILRSLHLNILKAEIATLGGRIRNILVISGNKDQGGEMALALRDALRSLIHRSSGVNFRDGFKRRRAMNGSLAKS